ncbi:MAG TPA: Gfo/Idh/MocA family oxidoreductase [Chthoniobacterales bacterium]|jgi:predicted dehydrogenase
MHYCIVGCGSIARTHATVLTKLARFIADQPTQLSFASRDASKAREYRSRFNGELALGSYGEAFSHRAIDVVVLCTPNHTHRDLAIAALDHGKHVVIEKPIACTTAEADEILAAAKRVGRHVLVAENHRYRPNVMALERIVRSGDLGQIKLIRINVLRRHELKQNDWRADRDCMGGGIFIDAGIHWVNVLLTLGRGFPVSITAYEPPPTNHLSTQEDSIVVSCQFENGAVGLIAYSGDVRGAFPLSFFSAHGSSGSVYSFNAGRIGFLNRRVPQPLFFPFRDWRGYEAMWKDFLQAFASGHPGRCLVTGEIGRRDLAFVEAAYRSAKRGPVPGPVSPLR